MLKRIKQWLARERRMAVYINKLREEKPDRELSVIKEAIWRRAVLAQTKWIYDIADRRGECLFGKPSKGKTNS